MDVFVWAGGARVADTPIWCDPDAPRDLRFVSSARGPWSLGSGRVVTTQLSLDIRRGSGQKIPAQPLTASFGRPFALGRLRLELLPAGGLPGAAQLLVDGPRGRALYAGQVQPAATRLGGDHQVRGCDAIAVAAPLLAATLEALPARDDVYQRLAAAVADALAAGRSAQVLVDSWLAADVGAALAALGVAGAVAARPLARLTAAVAAAAGQPAPLAPLPSKPPATPRVILASPTATPLSGAARFAVAATPSSAADASFAIADSADFPSLCAFIRATGAAVVYLTAPREPSIADALAKATGVPVRLLGPPTQMSLASV